MFPHCCFCSFPSRVIGPPLLDGRLHRAPHFPPLGLILVNPCQNATTGISLSSDGPGGGGYVLLASSILFSHRAAPSLPRSWSKQSFRNQNESRQAQLTFPFFAPPGAGPLWLILSLIETPVSFGAYWFLSRITPLPSLLILSLCFYPPA